MLPQLISVFDVYKFTHLRPLFLINFNERLNWAPPPSNDGPTPVVAHSRLPFVGCVRVSVFVIGLIDILLIFSYWYIETLQVRVVPHSSWARHVIFVKKTTLKFQEHFTILFLQSFL